MRSARGWTARRIPWLVLVTTCLVGAASSRADTASEFRRLGEAGADLATLRVHLEQAAPRLAHDSASATYRDGITVCAEGEEDHRVLLIRGVRELLARRREALASMGFPAPEKPPEIVLVFASTSDPGERAVAANDRLGLVRRGGDAVATAEPPPMPDRNGPGCSLREACSAARAIQRWVSAGLAAPDPGALEDLPGLLDRWAVAEALPAGSPAWIREGLAAVLQARLEGKDPRAVPAHITSTYSGQPIHLRDVLAAAEVPSRALPPLRRLVADLLEKRKEFPADVRALAGAPGGEGADRVFGADLERLLGVACAPGPDTTTCEDGVARCPLCRGLGRLEIACTVCRGSGERTCPACKGDDTCYVPTCKGGTIRYAEIQREDDCQLCKGGHLYCKVCSARGRVRCEVCRGKGHLRIPCPACDSGGIPCLDCPAPAGGCATCGGKGSRACPIHDHLPPEACADCDGTGLLGCATCKGSAKEVCELCGGSGLEVMIYQDRTNASISKCDRCGGRGWKPCTKCRARGSRECGTCRGKGKKEADRSACPLCGGDGRIPCFRAPPWQAEDR